MSKLYAVLNVILVFTMSVVAMEEQQDAWWKLSDEQRNTYDGLINVNNKLKKIYEKAEILEQLQSGPFREVISGAQNAQEVFAEMENTEEEVADADKVKQEHYSKAEKAKSVFEMMTKNPVSLEELAKYYRVRKSDHNVTELYKGYLVLPSYYALYMCKESEVEAVFMKHREALECSEKEVRELVAGQTYEKRQENFTTMLDLCVWHKL